MITFSAVVCFWREVYTKCFLLLLKSLSKLPMKIPESSVLLNVVASILILSSKYSVAPTLNKIISL